MTRVAIMQPTYLPWSGYFGLMQAVDIFIILDSVQFAKRSWQQRNQIKTAKGAQWLTVPVASKGKREQIICKTELDSAGNFASTHRKTIETNYGKAASFKDLGPGLLACIEQPQALLADLNIGIIEHCCVLLGIATPLLRSSRMRGSGAKADLLASLCKEVGATEYISVPGSRDYLNESSAFEEIGVPVRYFNYRHPEYPQLFGDFLPYMSVIDMLFNCGDRSADLIRSGVEVSA
jgi:hypothetical protein